MKPFKAPSGKQVTSILKRIVWSRFYTIRQINRKYSTPRIKTTPMVKIALLMLRIYLILLVLILIYKFYTLAK
jgi:uncharacterized membrane protein YidH (DUF202 family)